MSDYHALADQLLVEIRSNLWTGAGAVMSEWDDQRGFLFVVFDYGGSPQVDWRVSNMELEVGKIERMGEYIAFRARKRIDEAVETFTERHREKME